jgi:hypothetical protein
MLKKELDKIHDFQKQKVLTVPLIALISLILSG